LIDVTLSLGASSNIFGIAYTYMMFGSLAPCQ
jgi:hypothetical protein